MKEILILISMLFLLKTTTINLNCDAYVLSASTEHANVIDNKEAEQTLTDTIGATAAAPTMRVAKRRHEAADIATTITAATTTTTTNIVQPHEIREPQFPELASFIHIVEQQQQQQHIKDSTVPLHDAEQIIKTLTYSDLYRLLALWQLAREKNYYEMHAAAGKHHVGGMYGDNNNNYAAAHTYN